MKTMSMKKTLKAAHPFDASSALLFAVLSIGAISAASTAQAQTSTTNPPLTAPASNTQTRPATKNSGFAPPIPTGATTSSPALAPQLGNPGGKAAVQAQKSQPVQPLRAPIPTGKAS